MLTIGVELDEPVYIGRDVMVKVWRTTEGRLRLSIQAPKHIIIERSSVRRRREELQTQEKPNE